MPWLERVPPRYEVHPARQFEDAIRPYLRPGIAVLDVGAGVRPAIAPESRPPACRYVGLDVSEAELARTPAGSYTDAVVADVVDRRRELEDEFDLVVSWQVLEHVTNLERALRNIHAYLREGGALVAMLSGRFSMFAMLNRAIPHRPAGRILRALTGRSAETVFPARYDRCYHSALTQLLRPWSRTQVRPIYQGGAYFNFSRPLRAAYFRYEDWTVRSGRRNLATHYLVVAER